MIDVDWLVIGAGITGITFAQQKAEQGNKVLLVDKNNHIGGHCYDEYNDSGVLIHRYGPHVFHTNSSKVWNYLSRFTEWHYYYQKTRAQIDGNLIRLPINTQSLRQLFSEEYANKLERLLIEEFGFGARKHVYDLQGSNNEEIRFLGDYIFKKVFAPYSSKQWGMRVEDLEKGVSGRVPVVIGPDDRYFDDKYQAMPKLGYTRMFEKMLDHENIRIMLNTDGLLLKDIFPDAKILYTGPIDAFFDYRFGKLPYRAMRVEHETFDQEEYQPVTTVNYPSDYDYVRVVEYKKMTGQRHEKTSISREYPEDYMEGVNLASYPVLTEENKQLFKKYKEQASALENTYFAGRLADYLYYNMDQAVARALKVSEDL